MTTNQPEQEERLDQQLLSQVRRNFNCLREKQLTTRRNAIVQLLKIVTEKSLAISVYEQIMHMGVKDIVKCYQDHYEAIRETSINLTIELLSRCNNIRNALSYIFQSLKDRTNCVNLEGIDNLDEKLRPQPGQKPKMMLKINENCEEIRLLYCKLIKRIIPFLEQYKNEKMQQNLNDMVNILRALIMDPAPEVQKQACEVLKIFCNQYKDLLLHFTETMGRAVLLPIISKKSKIRIAGLQALTAVLWCGLWKYNAFVFQNLIGFRDPNSVPIKDFYQPSNNINYLATFITDPNVRVRQQFLRHLKIWICDLNDKFDHHGKLVPYLLSGLFDVDEKVRSTAVEAIANIGKQIEEEKEKQFRQNKQFAIDAAWTWEGKLVGLPVDAPLKGRPSLGSRFFVRGHVRKFWPALYKEIRDLNQQNRVRSANLALYGVIYTENYLTQFLDNFIPQMLPSILPTSTTDSRVSQKICKIFYYIGRYCEQSAYIHLIKSALEGKLIQNQQFVKCSMKGLAMLIAGNLDAIPENEHLCHKKDNIIQLLTMLQQCQISGDVYNFNCIEAREIAQSILKGLLQKASQQQRSQIFSIHFLSLTKLIAVSYFQQLYCSGYSLKISEQVENSQNQAFTTFVQTMDNLYKIYPNGSEQIQDFLSNVFCSPPSLMDSDWKMLTIFYRYLCIKGPHNQDLSNLFLLVQDTISECLSQNRSVDLLAFTIKFAYNLIATLPNTYADSNLNKSDKLVRDCLNNLQKFKPIKKVPIYDQNLTKQDETPDLLKTSQQNYFRMFIYSSKSLSRYYLNKIPLTTRQLAELIHSYLKCFKKVFRNNQCHLQAIKTIWAIFQKLDVDEQFAKNFSFEANKNETVYMIPEIIDFCVERLEEYLQGRLNKMVFDILENITKAWPKIVRITEPIPSVYADFPELLQKLFKYSLNERDPETKQKYSQFLQKLGKKMPDWFKYQSNRAQQQKRFQKAKLIQDIIYRANI